jgi:hypothetical protein
MQNHKFRQDIKSKQIFTVNASSLPVLNDYSKEEDKETAKKVLLDLFDPKEVSKIEIRQPFYDCGPMVFHADKRELFKQGLSEPIPSCKLQEVAKLSGVCVYFGTVEPASRPDEDTGGGRRAMRQTGAVGRELEEGYRRGSFAHGVSTSKLP